MKSKINAETCTIIGIVGPKRKIDVGGVWISYSDIRTSYAESILDLLKSKNNLKAKNIVCIHLPPIHDSIPQYLDFVDGVIVGGGDKNICPSKYGKCVQKNTTKNDDSFDRTGRVEFDLDLIKACLEIKKPLLGICLGMELINVALGGTLKKIEKTKVAHFKSGKCADALEVGHELKWSNVSNCFFNAQEQKKFSGYVNTAHSYCVDRVGKNLNVIAVAKGDNVIEAIVHKTAPILGVQWHPELMFKKFSKTNVDIFGGFLDIVIKQKLL